MLFSFALLVTEQTKVHVFHSHIKPMFEVNNKFVLNYFLFIGQSFIL